MYAEVILAKVSRSIDRVYHYAIPSRLKDKVQIGSQVLVPFGRRRDVGYVVGLVEKTNIPLRRIKEILKVSDEQYFDERSVVLAKWMADYYFSFFISALNCIMPPGRKKLGSRVKGEEAGLDLGSQKLEIGLSQLPTSNSNFQTGIHSQILTSGFELTSDQQKALDLIISAIDNQKSETILLYGITGSGKTEVYMQAISYLLKLERDAIVLVPEISLTPQLIQRFKERFGDLIAVLHSEITLKQRGIEWGRVERGEAKIVLGTRSAIFAPVKNLGIVVIDEEYEVTYKQEQNPKYHAREVAEFLSKTYKIPLVLGSATPSIETFYKAKAGEYNLAALPERIDKRPLPPVEIVDMRREKERSLSKRLREELKEVLSRGEQAILFINRRGFFTFVICRECGTSIQCPKCSIALTYHSGDRKLRCNRCGWGSDAPIICPNCQSSSLHYFGIGTQRIEKEVAEIFPTARILRYDRDSVRAGSHELFFSAFSEGKADVLIGTQMVTKGLDIAKVTLIGAVAADIALNLPDFRSAEHTFQLLTQVAGRAGRHHLPGKVIIQTYNPEHYAIKAASTHNYEEFYEKEIEFRQELSYPPFSKLINLLITGPEEKKVIKVAEDLKRFLARRLKEGVLGPAPAPFHKIRGHFRWQILVKGKDLDIIRKAVVQSLEKVVVLAGAQVAVDVEPMGML